MSERKNSRTRGKNNSCVVTNTTHSFSNKLTKDIKDIKDIKNMLMELSSEDMIQNWQDKRRKFEDPNGIAGIHNLLRNLNTDPVHGLSTYDVDKMRYEYGDNMMPELPSKTLIEMFFESFEDETLQILIGAAGLSVGIGLYDSWASGWEKPSYMEGVSIFIAILLVAIVTSWNNYVKEQQFKKLNQVSENISVKIIRDGKQMDNLKLTDIVVGDLVRICAGFKIPADGVVVSIDSNTLIVNESAINGEPDPKEKKITEDIFLISSTEVTEGECLMIVTAVGPNSYEGNQRAKLQEPNEHDKTPLQERLDVLANQIGQLGKYTAYATFAVIVILWIFQDTRIKFINKSFVDSIDTNTYKNLEFDWDDIDLYLNRYFAKYILDAFIVGVTIVVVAVPEGLPLAVTLSLSYSSMKMMGDMNLVKTLAAVETMGNATRLCSDKTGTLTKGVMTVVGAFVDYKFINHIQLINRNQFRLDDYLRINMVINNTAELIQKINNKDIELVGSGNSSEIAMLKLLNSRDEQKYKEIRNNYKVISRLTYNSDTKHSKVFVHLNNGRILCLVKGGHDTILNMCRSTLTAQQFKIIDEEGIKYAKQGKRVFAFAHKELLSNQNLENRNDFDLRFDGMIFIQDPLRDETTNAVLRCQAAGIRPMMITGDHVDTANSIGTECGIKTKNGLVFDGAELRKMVSTGKDIDPRLLDIIENIDIIGRATPGDKLTIVKYLQHLGNVVGMTGDGTNDAPALKRANVGLAMNSGTDIAKSAADIIIMDDNFASIVKAVEWGRCTFDNIRKFLQFQLTVNVVALVFTFYMAVKGEELPLNAVMMLWVNMIMDTFGALALGTESPNPEKLMGRLPYKKDASLVSWTMMKNILIQAGFQLAVLIFLKSEGSDVFINDSNKYSHEDKETFINTIIFNVFVFCQVINEFNARTIDDNDSNVFSGLTKNKLFLLIIGITCYFQYNIVTYAGMFVNTIPIDTISWVKCFFIATLSFPIGWFMRFINVSWLDKGDSIELDKEQMEMVINARKQIQNNKTKSKELDLEKKFTSLVHKIVAICSIPIFVAVVNPDCTYFTPIVGFFVEMLDYFITVFDVLISLNNQFNSGIVLAYNTLLHPIFSFVLGNLYSLGMNLFNTLGINNIIVLAICSLGAIVYYHYDKLKCLFGPDKDSNKKQSTVSTRVSTHVSTHVSIPTRDSIPTQNPMIIDNNVIARPRRARSGIRGGTRSENNKSSE
jgi:Ca2+-transporting ATPase